MNPSSRADRRISILAMTVLVYLSGCCIGGDSSPTGMPTGMCFEPLWWTVRNAVAESGGTGGMLKLTNGELVQLLGVCDRPWHQLGMGSRTDCMGHVPGEEAAQFVQSKVSGRHIRIELGEGLSYVHPRIGRVGAYVFLDDGTFLNEELIRQGFARYTEQPNIYGGATPQRYASVFREAEEEARDAERGFWKVSADSVRMRAAIDQRDADALRALLAGGAKIDFRDPQDRTPLFYAAEIGAAKIVEILLAHGAAIEARVGRESRTPLLAAAESGQADALRVLLEHGADVNARAAKQRSVLILAAASGDVETVRLLLPHTPDVETTDEDGETPLIAAAGSGNPEVVSLLLQHGADLARTKRSPRNWTAFHSAAEKGSVAVLELLLEHGAPIDAVTVTSSRETTPLQLAIIQGDTTTAAFLLEHGSDANFGSGQPLSASVSRRDLPMTALLIAHGADARIRDGNGRTAFDRAGIPAMREVLAGGHPPELDAPRVKP